MPNAVTLSLWLNTTPPLLASVAAGLSRAGSSASSPATASSRASPAILTAEENAMSQSHLVVDFPIKGPAIAKALPEELPPLTSGIQH
jgi:hypothetical protein